MTELPILSATIFTPIIGLIVLLVLTSNNDERVIQKSRFIALATTIITLALSLIIWWNFDNTTADFQFTEQLAWFGNHNISYFIGLDGVSIYFVILTAFLMPLSILASWNIKDRIREYMALFLALETLIIGAFCALDIVLFYLFFEGMLVPMFFIIGMWGGKRKVYAAFKFFLYTLAGSVLFLIAFLYIYAQTGTTDITELMTLVPQFSLEAQKWLWLAFFVSFAVKIPMWPVHTWLPDAHVEAPTAGSVILAGVMIKVGAYGFIRLSLPLFPEASHYFANFVFVLSLIAVIYASLVALVQTDIKKLIAYSSIAHMGFITIGIFSFTHQGIEGAVIKMISHGLISGALFLCVGVIYERTKTREIARFGGFVETMPKYAIFFMIFSMGAIGLPGTSGFVGEFLVLVGAFLANNWVPAISSIGIVLGAAYMLLLYRHVFFGRLSDEFRTVGDLNTRENIIFIPLAVMILVMGLYPTPFLADMNASVANIVQQVFIK